MVGRSKIIGTIMAYNGCVQAKEKPGQYKADSSWPALKYSDDSSQGSSLTKYFPSHNSQDL